MSALRSTGSGTKALPKSKVFISANLLITSYPFLQEVRNDWILFSLFFALVTGFIKVLFRGFTR